MTALGDPPSRTILQSIARRAMIARGLLPDFTSAALAELDAIRGPVAATDAATRDLRHLPWCSIDNNDSRDLDELAVAESLTEPRYALPRLFCVLVIFRSLADWRCFW